MGVLESVTTGTGANPVAPSPPASVLVIDDEAGVRQALSAMLQADGYAVVTAGSGKEAVEQSRRRHFDLAITDLLMPEMDGIQTMAALKGVDPALEVMVLTGHGGVDCAVDALRQGACDYLRKPLTMAQLCTAVAGALEKHQRNTPPSLFPAPASPTQKVMGLGRIRDREAWAYTLALALAVVMTASLLHFHIGRLYQEATAQWEARQSSVAEDRAQRVSDWLMERQADAELFSNRPAVRAGLQAYHVKGQLPGSPAGGRAELTAALDEMASVYYYNGVYLLDSDAHLVAQSNYAEPLSPRLAEISRTVARTGTLRPEVLSGALGKTLVSFSAPVVSRRGATAGVRSTDPPRGVVVLVVDASQTLFPILTRESIPTRTGETLLARREGDDVVIFSPLRHVPAGSPNLRFPLSTAPLATRTALEGRKTFVEYKDYRGVPVLAATQYIPAAGWGMVHKIDRAEAYENVRQMAIVEELAAGLLIIMLGGLLAFHRRTVLMRALQQKEGEFRALLESAPDAMAITDREGRIVLVNAQAEILFGFGRKELIGQTLGMLFPEWARERSGGGGPEDFSEVVARHVGKTFEMRGLRKGGKESPFEVRLSPVQEIEGGLFSCGIRDITQRKRAEQALARERDLLCALMDSTPDYIYFKDCQSRFLRINLAHAKALGLSDSGQAVGKTDFDFFPEEDAKGYFSDERQVIQTGQPLIGRVEKVRQADGQLRWVSTTKVSTRDAQGRITGLVGITRDVTERQRAEVEMEERHRLATLAVEVGAALTGAESLRQGLQQCTEILAGRIDAAFARVWTVNEAESVLELQASAGMYTHINGGHARVPMGKLKIGRIAESGEPHLTNSVREDSWVGDPEWARREGMVAFAGYPLKIRERVLGVVAAFARKPLTEATLQAFSSVAHNLAQFIERKGTEEELRDGEEKYRVLYESSRDAIMMVAPPEWGFTAGNPAAIALFGARDEQEFLAVAPWSLSPEYQPDGELSSVKARQNIDAAMERGSHFFEWTHKKFSGEEFFAAVTLTRMIYRGQPLLQATVRDITERKRAEAEHTQLITAIEQSAEAVVITNTNGDIEYVNPAFTWITGYSREEVLGQNPRILKSGKQDPGFYQQLWATILQGEIWHGELINRKKDGSLYTEEMNIAPVRSARGEVTHFIATKQDVTGRKTLEAQLQQAAKMEAIGRLAGGVAHDFNNLLTIINGYAELLLDKFAADNQVGGQLKQIQDAGERAASLTRQLLAFSRRQVLASQVLDLNAVVSNVEKMLRRLIGEDVKLHTFLDPSLGRVKADPGQIEQVIMNLAVNARDAMPSGGNLTLETSNVELDEAYARTHATVKPGPHVMLAVSDSGVGMTPEAKTHIFEPFFTTKEKGKGTGLGLATVYGIVKQSGGSIWVYSELGQGTVFKIYLPTVSESPAARGHAKTETDTASGSETILVVEDEQGVRSLVRLALESSGYKVLEMADAESALAACANYDGPIHLLLTDVVMPQMSGPVVAEKVAALRPGIKVLFMSGYTDDAVVRHGVLSHDMPFIQKPFSPLALRKKIREVLGGK